jgi:predicted CXXCH cytochrome family protein
MLKAGEPQLCMSCHSEVKPDFTKPFHHKVLEGVMKCSDCHNPHGGFELKQTRLAVGADAACIKCHADKQGPFTYETRASQNRRVLGLPHTARLIQSQAVEIQRGEPALSHVPQRSA